MESDLERNLEEELRAADIGFVKDIAVGGFRPDYVVTLPSGEQAIIEAKAARDIDEARLQRQARRIEALTGLAAAVVLPAATGVVPGVVGLDALAMTLSAYLSERAKGRKGTSPPAEIRDLSTTPRVFAAMPFAESYDDTYWVAITGACIEVGAAAERVDHDEFTGDVVAHLFERIQGASALVADVSESRPNVLYEVGLAYASGTPSVQITSTPMEGIPFDVRNQKTLRYRKGQTKRLVPRLARELAAVLDD